MLNQPFRFLSKAGTLDALNGLLVHSKLCEQRVVTGRDWKESQHSVITELLDTFADRVLIVRSSASNEDTWGSSMAGAHLSVANVTPELSTLESAIEAVFASYRNAADEDEVLVQPMITDVSISGVVLTRELDTGSPYYVVNYDDFSGRTDTVTGGRESTTVMVRRGAHDKLRSERMRKLLRCVMEVENVTGEHELDIEFCADRLGDIYILQVRPLSAREMWGTLADDDINSAVEDIRSGLVGLMAPKENLAGTSTIFTEMTDWNPAEMIGNTPRPLALSMYKSLITDSVWAKARMIMGYRMVDGPLLFDFYGRPFIDVRKSFNSFLPVDIPDATAQKLVNHQLQRLATNRELHDKVEFEICVSCWDFAADESRRRFADAGLSATEAADLENSLVNLTKRLLESGGPKLSALIGETENLLNDNPETAALPPALRIPLMLEACRDKGTLVFAQLARHGFIGVQFLRSMVRIGIMDKAEMSSFMQSITTVATDLSNDLFNVYNGLMERDLFLSRYGHLRPGTYDITSWRYDERPDMYLGHANTGLVKPQHEPFPFSTRTKATMEIQLSNMGYDVTADQLIEYITTAIQGRERAKFAFTKVISDILVAIVEWGETTGLPREELSFLPIESFAPGIDADVIHRRIEVAKNAYNLTRALRLPHVILVPDDIDIVRMPLGQPTFITNKSVTAKAVLLSTVTGPNIDGSIVMVESADPGFDWIFSHPILGLITKYGGANSHMAIRCAEFGLPAAIGCGERLFDNLCKAKVVELNAASKRLGTH